MGVPERVGAGYQPQQPPPAQRRGPGQGDQKFEFDHWSNIWPFFWPVISPGSRRLRREGARPRSTKRGREEEEDRIWDEIGERGRVGRRKKDMIWDRIERARGAEKERIWERLSYDMVRKKKYNVCKTAMKKDAYFSREPNTEQPNTMNITNRRTTST